MAVYCEAFTEAAMGRTEAAMEHTEVAGAVVCQKITFGDEMKRMVH